MASVVEPTISVVELITEEPITSTEEETITVVEFRNATEKNARLVQQDQIKEDDKNVTVDIPVYDSGGNTMHANSIAEITDTKEAPSTWTTSVPPFSPSPYLGTVVEEVIEEPIADHRESVQTNFIPMKSRQSFNSFIDDTPTPRQYPSFHTASSVIPVLGDSYSLHSDSAINEDFDNPNFNDNPYGKIKFPDEKSKYFPLFLTDNEIGNQEKPLKFDHDGNYKQYDFPYKIENAGYEFNVVDAHKEPQISDKTHLNKYQKDRIVHGAEIMQNVSTVLPLETKKSFPTKHRHTAWKKVAHTVMAFLPIGLMLAAIPPRVVKVNSTSLYPA
ncbi:hypothetical protein WDU94_014806 [Cyamophila willieti]